MNYTKEGFSDPLFKDFYIKLLEHMHNEFRNKLLGDIKGYIITDRVPPNKKIRLFHHFPNMLKTVFPNEGPFTFSSCGGRYLEKEYNQDITPMSEDAIDDLFETGKLCFRCYSHLLLKCFE